MRRGERSAKRFPGQSGLHRGRDLAPNVSVKRGVSRNQVINLTWFCKGRAEDTERNGILEASEAGSLGWEQLENCCFFGLVQDRVWSCVVGCGEGGWFWPRSGWVHPVVLMG